MTLSGSGHGRIAMSLERVKAKVLEAAQARAEAELNKARAEVERILSEGKAADERVAAETTRDAALRLERETVRELERLDHDNRLHILHAKNSAIDHVFKRVLEKLKGMTDSEYLGLVGKWLDALPENAGGVLKVNPRDEAKFTSGLDELNRNRSGDGLFTAVQADPAVQHGVVVDGPEYSIDCTVNRRLSELRETSAGDLAKVLFDS